MTVLQKARDFVNKNGWFIVIGLLLVIGILMYQTFRKTKGQEGGESYQETLKANLQTIKALEAENKALNRSLEIRDSTIARLNRLDSLQIIAIQKTNQTINELEKQRKALSRFDNLSSSELQEYFSNLPR